MRIQDDELFAKDNSLLDRDITAFDAHYAEPVWDSVGAGSNCVCGIEPRAYRRKTKH